MSQATHELFERRGVHVVKRILIRFIEVAIDAQHSDPHVGVVLVILVELRQGLVEETEVVGNACLHVVRLKVGLDRRELNGEELSRGCITFDEAEDVEEVHRPLVLPEDVEHSARVNGSPAAPNTELDEVALHARGERVLNAAAVCQSWCGRWRPLLTPRLEASFQVVLASPGCQGCGRGRRSFDAQQLNSIGFAGGRREDVSGCMEM